METLGDVGEGNPFEVFLKFDAGGAATSEKTRKLRIFPVRTFDLV